MLRDIVIPVSAFEQAISSFKSGCHSDDIIRKFQENITDEDGQCDVENADVHEEFGYFDHDWESNIIEDDTGDDSFYDSVSHLKCSFTYPREEDDKLANSPLYLGSTYEGKDLCRALLELKSANAVIGDRLLATIVGLIVTFLPKENLFADILTRNPTMYSILKTVQNAADMQHDMKTYAVHTCPNGCVGYLQPGNVENFCPICQKCRWKHCGEACFENGVALCSHTMNPKRRFYYLSVRDRIAKLLNSDLNKMFHYEDYRHKSSDDNLMEDIFDTRTYSLLKSKIPPDAKLIFLQVCWDGADMFNYAKNKSMWPLCYSIMNLPPSLRDKPHIGMHVASFDDGSRAALDFFSREMLSLWRHPIVHKSTSYYVVVGQILMDGRGRESFCGVQGAGSKAGCNLCHCESRTFKRRRVFDSFRRYLPCNDTTRYKASRKNKDAGLQFAFDEILPPPKKRTYASYVYNARTAANFQSSGRVSDKSYAHDGVKSLWPLHILPYAHFIHWTVDMMHTMNNVIQDCVKSLRPNFSGDTSMGQSANRTMSANVVEGCRLDGIHPNLSSNNDPLPPWVFTKKECLLADQCLKRIIGARKSDEKPVDVMKRGHANNSHDTIYWAMTFARWCFRNKGNKTYTDNICELFDIFTLLHSPRLDPEKVEMEVKPRLINALVTRSGLVPPSECPITLHELVHICDQVPDIGVPRINSLYKFERMNHILKQLLQNSAKGLPSIIKNYLEHEQISIHLALSIQNVQKIDELSAYKPSNAISKDIDHTLRGVFVDTECEGKPIMYDIDNAGIMELNGASTSLDMTISDFNWLMLTAAENASDTSSLIYILLQKYRKRSSTAAGNNMDFITFISHTLSNEQSLERMTRQRKDDKVFLHDIELLLSTVRQALLDNRFIIRIYKNARIKSVQFKGAPLEMNSKGNYPTYSDMSAWGDNQKSNCFLCVPSAHDATTTEYAFGIARYFVRLDMTSGIDLLPFVYVSWCSCESRMCTPTYFEGTMTQHEWTTGPSERHNVSPFVALDRVIPSRFVLAYDVMKDDDTIDIAFLALDGKRVGDNVSNMTFTDFADDEILQFNVAAMRTFLKNDKAM